VSDLDFKGGVYVAVVGKTNAGKSTLVNALVGEKVSIVSPKKQTTRENILGILNEEDFQIIFVDTPGIHKTTNQLGKNMLKNVRSAMNDTNLIIYVVDASRGFDEKEFETISNKSQEQDIIVVLNKIDIAGFAKTYPLIDKFNQIKQLKLLLPISAAKNENLSVLKEEIKKYLEPVEEEILEFRDTYTDKSVKFMSEEIIREKALYLLNEEIPHGIFVEIIRFDEKKKSAEIDADIICAKKTHKAIIIGKNGDMLKKIATQSRIEIEKLLDKKVMLTCYVKTRDK
jgi:GTP-binding protein Era